MFPHTDWGVVWGWEVVEFFIVVLCGRVPYVSVWWRVCVHVVAGMVRVMRGIGHELGASHVKVVLYF